MCSLPILGLLGACSGLAIVDALTPRWSYNVERDIRYGQDPRQQLDLYLPDTARPGAPLIVFFYGGGWETGSKSLYRFVGQAFTSLGYLVAIPDYRLYPQVRYTGILDDGAAAVAALAQRLCHQDAGSARRPLFLIGHSAGAYIAAMLALDQRRLERAGAGQCRPIAVDAAVGLAGPYDFLPLESARLREIFGPGPAVPATQPIRHVDPSDPPMLLLTGTADRDVRPGNTLRLAAALREAGVRAETRLYDSVDHIRPVAALAAPLRLLAPVRADIDSFLRSIPVEGR